jgi:chorismate dehydratase
LLRFAKPERRRGISAGLKGLKVLAIGTESRDFRGFCYTGTALFEERDYVSLLRISIVQYLNTAPLVRGFTHGALRGKYELSFTVPSKCAEALRTGAADVAIIPAIEYQRIPNLVILPNLSIASKNSVRSLLVVSRKPIAQAARVALDWSSRSTQTLVRILCDACCETTPEFFEAPPDLPSMLANADAALLIGDPALQLAIACGAKVQRDTGGAMTAPARLAGLLEEGTLFIYDVVELWRNRTNTPAVLAVWAARPEVVTPELVKDFQDSLAYGLSQLDAIATEAAKELHLPASELRRYLTENIDYQLDEENLRGLIHYYSAAARLGLIHRVNGIEFAAEPGGPVRYVDLVFSKRQA